MEELLHFAWKNRIYPLKELSTTTRMPLEILDPGLPNTQAGPDFLQAKIKISETTWAGNVELHVRASDWYRHKHETNPVYDSVILHVVLISDCVVCNSKKEPIPQLVLPLSRYVLDKYKELKETDSFPRCYAVIPTLSKFVLHSWMSVLQCERVELRTQQILERLQKLNNNWSDCFFVTLARNFGFGVNGDVFEQWALSIPLRAVDKHRDNLLQIEAIFFGQAGLLELNTIPEKYQATALNEGYFVKLRKEYLYLAHKFALRPINFYLWKFLRMRPANFPHIRIAQLAKLYFEQKVSLSQVIDVGEMKGLKELFTIGTSEYWENHSTFGASCEKHLKTIQPKTIQLIVINSIAPFLFAYGKHQFREAYKLRAFELLESLPPEDNYIIRMWEKCGYTANNAADTQSLIQLKKEYCDKRECLRCRIGFIYLKSNKND